MPPRTPSESGLVISTRPHSSVAFPSPLLNIFEDLDGDGTEDHADNDDDSDGFDDQLESEFGSDPRDPTSTPNHPPASLSFSARSFSENLPIGSKIGDFSATDRDANSSFRFSLVDGNGSDDNFFLKLMPTDPLVPAPLLISRPMPPYIRFGFR